MHAHEPDTLDPAWSTRRAACAASADGGGTDADCSPQNWRDLGQRVLAEAMRRTTDELAGRMTKSATPVARAFDALGSETHS